MIVIVNVYLCGKTLLMSVLCTNSKYVSSVSAVLCLFMLMSSNISETYVATKFGYFSDTPWYVMRRTTFSPAYHLTWWRKQICCFVRKIGVEHAKVLWYWGCESCVCVFNWIVYRAIYCLLNRSLSLFVETASKPSESLKYLVPFLST